MKKNKLTKISLINLCAGYLLCFFFIFFVLFNLRDHNTEVEIVTPSVTAMDEEILFNGVHEETPVITVTPPVIAVEPPVRVIEDLRLGRDRLTGVIIPHEDPIVATVHDTPLYLDRDVLGREGDIIIDDSHRIGAVEGHIGGRDLDRVHHGLRGGGRTVLGERHLDHKDDDLDVDIGLLDRRLAELDSHGVIAEEYVDKNRLNRHDKVGINTDVDGIDMSKMTLARDGDDAELGDIDLDVNKNNGKNYGVGKGGELYAYNYPSRGVGAGIGSSAVGAGAGGGVGLGAAIGEGMLNGEVVPTLGGIGTGPEPLEGQPADALPSGGVGGLVGGAGAGGAAGLTQGYITEKLGMGMGAGSGAGYGGKGGRGYNYDHLPKDGALHIMMHVDGSGSILNTRKQLDLMKNTLLKDALLPYYKNDEALYNRRVTIISDEGERTLRFFTEAAKKDNVLAIAFQDEAQPAYHLPNFNKKPEDHYVDDLTKLKSSLNGYGGVYRGVMFQVDRGKTFAKSFKEFVGNAFRGEGYLESSNLKKYYRENNTHHIKNKDGIVFSDEYHAKDSGDPQYYLDLIFDASKKVGLDLNIYGDGERVGKAPRD
jgi:hypothetical protein